MASRGPRLRDLVEQLVERESPAGDSPDAAAFHAACERLYRHLGRWTGAEGSHALFWRALSGAQATHPPATYLQLRRDAEPHLRGTSDAVAGAGALETAAALEAVLTSVLEQLARFIGDDMVRSMVSRAVSGPDRPSEAGRPSGEAW